MSSLHINRKLCVVCTEASSHCTLYTGSQSLGLEKQSKYVDRFLFSLRLFPRQSIIFFSFHSIFIWRLQCWLFKVLVLKKRLQYLPQKHKTFANAWDALYGLEGFWCQALGWTSSLAEQPCWIYTLIALQQNSPLPRRFYTTDNWFKMLDLSDNTRTGNTILRPQLLKLSRCLIAIFFISVNKRQILGRY